ncbi:21S rRNA (uridine2791-2'-O) methyltransferase NDAI_0I00870 [Naumovozyma dairenensis CBS 421]|uniref:rRNA methyltransferase 2, mitochondrial n=1 Tax=Naumovozyma dairenensis (strain ATCC 10597 / BCRC 20456 / CBS 421 / NBRC 0211 / NRRL Y-12639) TaxID=1071378 RepID=G0WFU5_NAUDC|nr:hypothetical protein NDAI_0I00870 [Naumovozyma dairenensis CBS 421]CCD26656.1 hypothetical protein NDAI_0I00870 [Naumovozyma dairenensis CBS 421]
MSFIIHNNILPSHLGKTFVNDFSRLKQVIISRHNSNSQSRWLERQWNDHYTREAKLQNLKSRAAFKLIEIDDKFHLFNKSKTQSILDLGFAPGAWSQVIKSRSSPDSMILGVDILPCTPPHGVSAIQANILSRKTHELIRLFYSKHFKLNTIDKLHKNHGYFQHMLEEELIRLKETETYKEVFSSDDNSKIIKSPIDIILSDMYAPWPQDFNSKFSMNNITNNAYIRMANTSGLTVRDHAHSIDLCDAALITAIDLLKPKGNFVCKLFTGNEDKLFEKRVRKVFQDCYRFKPKSSRNESKEVYIIGLNKNEAIDKFDVFTT